MKIQIESMYLASFWPLQIPVLTRHSSPDHRGGTTHYRCPIYTLEDFKAQRPPALLEVTDTWQANLDAGTREHKAADPVSVQSRISDLITHWGNPDRDCQNGGRPAIWVASGPDVAFNSPEAQDAMALQFKYMEWLYYRGQEFAEQKRHAIIGDQHRQAGLWLGKEEPWVKNLVVSDVQTCPVCQSPVKPGAFVCATCRFQIKALPEHLAKLQMPPVIAPPLKAPQPVR